MGNSSHAFITPNSRMGKSTNAVPLTYQPMTGGIPNVWCNQGIITTRAIHNSSENAPNTTADDKIPIGRGVAFLILSIFAFFIKGSAVSPRNTSTLPLWGIVGSPERGALTTNAHEHIIANAHADGGDKTKPSAVQCLHHRAIHLQRSNERRRRPI
jgi:hypothetical protein